MLDLTGCVCMNVCVCVFTSVRQCVYAHAPIAPFLCVCACVRACMRAMEYMALCTEGIAVVFPLKCVCVCGIIHTLRYCINPLTGSSKRQKCGKKVHMELIISGHISPLLEAICFNCLLRSNMASNSSFFFH